MRREIEILAPAGSMECLKAAVAAGADAVYVGGSMFGARAYANNFTEEELLEAIDYVHLHGRKIFLTVNTLLKESELRDRLYQYLRPYYLHGLDAVIVQDVGVLRFIRTYFPDLPIHASTQMTITGVDGARFMESQGVDRVVTARELSMQEVAKIAEETKVEIESFVHGALCYCYSGQCLFSSFLGGRSGNRGQCAQPCRLLYQTDGAKNSHYLLSLKDICTLDLIPEMVEAGIYSFKIEGRMKKPEYVAGVVSAYRKYADLYLSGKPYKVEEKDKEALLDLYNRGGFHTGYYHTQNGKEMVSLERPNHAGIPAVKVLKKEGRRVVAKALTDLHSQDVIELPMRKGQEKTDTYTCKESVSKGCQISIAVFPDTPFQKGMIWNRTRNSELIEELRKKYLDIKIKEKINGKLILSIEESAKLTVNYGKVSVTVEGDKVDHALRQALDQERVRKQICKTGNTEFEFDHLEIEMNGEVFLPMQSLNELRRMALDELERNIKESHYRKDQLMEPVGHAHCPRREETVQMTASAQTLEQLYCLLEQKEFQRIYADCTAFPRIWETTEHFDLIRKAKELGKELYLIMPYIFREKSRQKYEQHYAHIFEAGWDGILVRNYESYGFLKRHQWEKPVITEYNLYQFNQEGVEFWKDEQIQGFTLPLELTEKEMRQMELNQAEIVVYGYIPMMVSASCVRKTLGKCTKTSGQMTVSDRYHKEFVVKNECDYCYNLIYNQVPLYLGDKMEEVHQLHAKAFRFMFTTENREEVQQVLMNYKEKRKLSDGEFTRGHWKNGVK